VTMDHLTIASDGRLLSVGHSTEWSIVIEVRYDADSEPNRG